MKFTIRWLTAYNRTSKQHTIHQLSIPTKRATNYNLTKRMSTFNIPAAAGGSSSTTAGEIQVNSTPDLSREQLLSFPAFRIWLSTLQHSLSLQRYPSHEFNKSPYILRRIDIQAVDYFGGKRLGFIKFKADVSNDSGESLPGSVFLRGGSVGMLVSVRWFYFGPPTDAF